MIRWYLRIAGLVLMAAPAAAAGNSGAADNELMLGPIQTFNTEREAQAACGPDGVVWAERHAGYYFKPGERQYGASPMASYACLGAMADANYWDTDPMGGVLAYRGKSFPSALRDYGSWGGAQLAPSHSDCLLSRYSTRIPEALRDPPISPARFFLDHRIEVSTGITADRSREHRRRNAIKPALPPQTAGAPSPPRSLLPPRHGARTPRPTSSRSRRDSR